MSFVLNSQDLIINFLLQSPCTSYNFRSENLNLIPTLSHFLPAVLCCFHFEFSLAPCNVFFDLNAVEIIWSRLYITQYLAWVVLRVENGLHQITLI